MQGSHELRDFVLLYYQAMASGDAGFLERHLSREQDLVVIGTDPGDWWTGFAAARAGLAPRVPGGMGGPLVAGNPLVHCEGNVGWVADRATMRLPTGAEIPCRLSMVWHLEDGRWKIAQQHLSVGAGLVGRSD